MVVPWPRSLLLMRSAAVAFNNLNKNCSPTKPAFQTKLLCGNSHVNLAQQIATQLSLPLSVILPLQLANGETILIMGESVRDCDVFILQTSTGHTPSITVNDYLFELCLIINACKAGSARRITAVIPCYPYARQDKKNKSRCPITAKLVANLISNAGADHIITMDLHAPQLQGFFNLPVDNLYAESILCSHVKSTFDCLTPVVLVSPDVGGVKRCASMADLLQMDFVIIHKERGQSNKVERMVLVGEVRDKIAIIVDDMADTCGTLIKAAQTLKINGAKHIYAMVIHGILSGSALEQINNSHIEKLIITNTVPLPLNCLGNKVEVLDVSMLFSEAIRRVHNGESVSSLYRSPSV